MVDEFVEEESFKGKICCHCGKQAELFHKVHLCQNCYGDLSGNFG